MRHILAGFLLFAGASVTTFAAVDQTLLALVPPGTKMIASVDISQARNSQIGQYMLSRMHNEDHSFEELIQQTGFDPRRDLQSFVFASTGPGAEGSKPNFVVIVRGTFDQSRIRTMAKTKGASIESYRGADLYIHDSDHPPTALAFADTGVLVMGDVATVEQVLANRGNPTPLDPGLQQLVSSAGANNDAWFASVMPGAYLANHLRHEMNQPAAGQALNSILQASGGVQFGDQVRLSFDGTARSPKDAQSLRDVIRFLGSMAQMNRQKGPNAESVASAVDSMDLRIEGDAVHVSVSVPEKTLEQLADQGVGVSHSRSPHQAQR